MPAALSSADVDAGFEVARFDVSNIVNVEDLLLDPTAASPLA